ncbi:hypothetical protein phytr_3980 [Candidatus Phycorickettsia trachydisci]|uniref:Uncharacterized protein n=1 Tax=Candidatus Phycorickettsia trachydisci TaxID=2115978 RepID=A0A2P1P7V4_9RICK|nr:hypothetical protein [Candidatus Phycorickettsia trachydisci]AVP87349.1 hypothetical protein phytr_3980 [Candidatus Phycorickettsia trachydisci]
MLQNFCIGKIKIKHIILFLIIFLVYVNKKQVKEQLFTRVNIVLKNIKLHQLIGSKKDVDCFDLINLYYSGLFQKEDFINYGENNYCIQKLRYMNDSSYVESIYTPLLNASLKNPDYEYTNGYNGSFIKYRESYLMAYRYDGIKKLREKRHRGSIFKKNQVQLDRRIKFNSDINIVLLDKDFKPISRAISFAMNSRDRQIQTFSIEDPRIFTFKDKIYVIYNQHSFSSFKKELGPSRGMYLSEIAIENNNIKIINNLRLFFPENVANIEKNWAPIVHNNELYFVYSVIPNLVLLKPNLKTGECKTFSVTKIPVQNFTKYYGNKKDNNTSNIHLGSILVQISNNSYISFLHTRLYDQNKKPQYYIIPAIYKWESDNKLYLEKIGQDPILAPFAQRSFVKLHSSIGATFPSGLFLDNNDLFVTLGINDCDTSILKLDKNRFLSSIRWISFRQ